ncbi:MAG: aspartate aminotransferase family protein [Opitutales bacterium]
MKTYAPPPFDAARGKGVHLEDTAGKRYLDFCGGIAVTSVGHAHPSWTRAVSEQAGTLAHCSNLYGIPGQNKLADRIVQRAGKGRVFFCNSGAEANEAMIKLARLHGCRSSNGEEGQRYRVVAANNAFHGRTFGGMSATPREKVQSGYRPLLEGFRFAELNQIESFDAQVDPTVAAVFIETIQGEGGVFSADHGFLRDLRALCSERGALLMIDEVQCGIGRTGDFFAYEGSGIQPDAIGMAKGLGGGFPIGAVWAGESCCELFQPGTHGTTFGGSPLAAAAANAVLDIIEAEELIERVRQNAPPWRQALRDLAARHPAHIREVRGAGYMVGLALHTDAATAVNAAREHGLLLAAAGENTVRLLPPLIATAGELAESVRLLDAAFSGLQA